MGSGACLPLGLGGRASVPSEPSILVTVAMAYEALDVPEVALVAALTHIRSRPWLEQMVARATRVDPHAGPYTAQRALVSHPDEAIVLDRRSRSPDLGVVAEPVGRAARAAPFDWPAFRVESGTVDDDQRRTCRTIDQPRLHAACRLHRQHLVRRGDNLPASFLIERVEQVAEHGLVELKDGAESRRLEPDLLGKQRLAIDQP